MCVLSVCVWERLFLLVSPNVKTSMHNKTENFYISRKIRIANNGKTKSKYLFTIYTHIFSFSSVLCCDVLLCIVVLFSLCVQCAHKFEYICTLWYSRLLFSISSRNCCVFVWIWFILRNNGLQNKKTNPNEYICVRLPQALQQQQ